MAAVREAGVIGKHTRKAGRNGFPYFSSGGRARPPTAAARPPPPGVGCVAIWGLTACASVCDPWRLTLLCRLSAVFCVASAVLGGRPLLYLTP